MLLFLQEIAASVLLFSDDSNLGFTARSPGADNEGVRRQVPLALLAIAVSYALVTGHVGFAQGFSYQAMRPSTGSQGSPAPDARIDINTASLDELMKAPGMTRTWAARIIRFRPYRAKNDLLDKGVVSNEVYGRIKDYIIARRTKQ
jgi:DNA uptake protein ComE-like DNA-binding protein